MKQRPLLRSFAGGVIAEELYGRLDLTKNQTALRTALNFWTLPHGPAQNRSGFEYVLEVKDSTRAAVLIPFAYNTQQTYALVFNAGKIRIHTQGGTLLEATTAISGATKANPGVITDNTHGYSNGDTIYLTGVGGMTELNGRFFVVANALANSYTLKDFAGNAIDTTGYTAYTAGGTAARVYEVAMPYADADLPDIHYTQSADVLTLVHPGYAPRELRRSGAVSWALTSITFVPTITAPTPTVTNSGAGAVIYQYKVTSVAQNGMEESLASAPATSSPINITGATKANPGVITAVAHGRSVDDPVYISGVGGMTQLAGEYLVNTAPDADHVTLKTLAGAVVDTTGYTAYTTGGTLAFAGIKNNLTTAGNYNTVSWSAATDAVRYNVYKARNGLYGYVGQTSGVTFKDDNITPDVSRTPAETDNPFAADFPGGVGYYEGRRFFGGTPLKPQNLWGTRSATESNLSYSIPTRDDDRIALRITSRDANTIRHILPMASLVVLTSGGEWKLAPQNSDILTPSSAMPKQDEAQGANNAQPIIAGRTALYASSTGGHVRQLSYQWQAQGYLSEDVSLMAPHLFDGYTVRSMAYLKAPYRMGFFVRSDGHMLGLTHLPEQQVNGWHEHSTAGSFESVCAVNEGDETALYALIQRTINGRSVRYIERLHSRRFATQADAFFVDAGVSYSGAAATVISGGYHLVGEKVSALADGAVWRNLTVDSQGRITLPKQASKVQYGIPITADLETLPLGYESLPAFGTGTMQNIGEAYLRLKETGGIQIGPAFDKLTLLKQRTDEAPGTAPRLLSGLYRHTTLANLAYDATLCVRQEDPLPVTISSMTLNVDVN